VQHEESVRGEKAIEDAQRVLGGFKERFAPGLEKRMRAKLGLDSERDADAPVRDLFLDRAAFDAWVNDYRARLSEETRDDAARAIAMNRVNPKFVLRNHLAETAIRKAKEKDFSEVERLAAVLRRPFDEQPEHEAYAAPPPHL